MRTFSDSDAGGSVGRSSSRQDSSSWGRLDGGKQTLKGGGTILGLGVEATGEANQQDSRGGGNVKGSTDLATKNTPAHRGFVEKCMEEAERLGATS